MISPVAVHERIPDISYPSGEGCSLTCSACNSALIKALNAELAKYKKLGGDDVSCSSLFLKLHVFGTVGQKEKQMQADDHAVEEILGEGRRFMVPLYQRKYQWHDAQLIPFWEDVEAKAIEVLEGESRFQHYMGALILSPIGEAAQIGVTPRVQVVDGQQRLTTFQLFLAALREVARKQKCDEVAEHVTDYLFNKLKSKDIDKLTRFKLTPTPSDQEMFHDIVEEKYSTIRSRYGKHYWGGRVPKNTQFRALRAYEEFYRLIDHFAQFGSAELSEDDEVDGKLPTIGDETDTSEAIQARLEVMLTALLNRMKLVVITLEEDDDAQVIFETLNSKGEPLLAMDLVRNNVFYRAEKEKAEVEDLYQDLWDPFDHSWWKEPAPFARPTRSRIDHFLAHVLAAETGQKISMRELYAEYRAFAVPKGRPRFVKVEDELKQLGMYSPIYETLEGRVNVDKDLFWLGRKFAAWQVTTAYPIAMQVHAADIDAEEKHKLYRLIYSYIVRRALSGLTAKNLNRVFQSLSREFIEKGPSVKTLKDYFARRIGDSTRFPGDREFREGILFKPAYTLAPQSRIKDVLWELEEASRTKFSERTPMPEGLWTEHVLPVSWTEEWLFEDGGFVERWSKDPRAENRNRVLHTLGNLTLLTGSLNISSSNKAFLEKRGKLEEHTGLFLNKWFLKKNSWSEANIRERGEALAEMSLTIWPSVSGDDFDSEQWNSPLDCDFTSSANEYDRLTDHALLEEPDASGRWHITLENREIIAATGADALEEVLRKLITGKATRLRAIAGVRGRVRPLIAQTPEALYPGRHDLTTFSREFFPGWFVGTNYSRRDVMRLIRAAAQACGLSWGTDILIK